MTQISLFDGDTPLKITKPIRLIELFAGYGSQSLALKYLKVPFEHWKICEWAVKSIQAYKDLHFGDDTCDYSKAYSVDELIEMLLAKGISADYNAPMTREQDKRTEQQILKEITDWAKEHNISTVYLIDEEFVKTALLNEIKRRNKEC